MVLLIAPYRPPCLKWLTKQNNQRDIKIEFSEPPFLRLFGKVAARLYKLRLL